MWEKCEKCEKKWDIRKCEKVWEKVRSVRKKWEKCEKKWEM